jgi:hypothetical protein
MTAGKQKRRRFWTALRKLQLRATYHVAAFQAKLFERPFWFFEQWRGRLMDRIDNERRDT